MLSLRKHKISRLEEFSVFDAFMFQVFGLQGRDTGMSLTELANASTWYGLGFCVLVLLLTALYSTPIDGARNAAAPLNRAQAT